jgi:hypothetical protein
MLWWSVDLGACDGLLGQQIEVPWHIDVRDLCEEFGPVKGVEYALQLTRERLLASPSIRYVVVDTVSELDKLWQRALEAEMGDEDSRWLYRKLLSRHGRFHGDIHRAVGSAKPIFLAHSAAISEPAANAPQSQKMQQKAARLPGGAEIKLDVTGKGHDIYINNASFVFTIGLEERKGQLPKRMAITDTTSFEVKNRLPGLFPSRFDPWLAPHLRAAQERMSALQKELASSAR